MRGRGRFGYSFELEVEVVDETLNRGFVRLRFVRLEISKYRNRRKDKHATTDLWMGARKSLSLSLFQSSVHEFLLLRLLLFI